jgi:hypothetical protein
MIKTSSTSNLIAKQQEDKYLFGVFIYFLYIILIPTGHKARKFKSTVIHLPEQHAIVSEADDYCHQIRSAIHFVKGNWQQ